MTRQEQIRNDLFDAAQAVFARANGIDFVVMVA